MRFLLVFFTIYTFILGSEFWVKDYETALNLAKQNGKPVMVEAMRGGCYYCMVMDEEIFENKEARAVIAKQVIPLRIDISREMMPAGIRTRVTPSFFFLDADGNLLKKLLGGWTREDFLEIIAGIGENQ